MKAEELRSFLESSDRVKGKDEDPLITQQYSMFGMALSVCLERERKYHGLWQKYGYDGVLGHLESKVARIRRAVQTETIQDDVDDIIDLLNYAGFMGRLVAFGMQYGEGGDEEDAFYQQLGKRAQDPVERTRMLRALGAKE
jgi:hypothetical protein